MEPISRDKLKASLLEAHRRGDTQAAEVFARKHKDATAALNGQSTAGGILDSVTQGVTLGFGDEITAAEAATLGKTPEGAWFDYSKPWGERYDAALAAERGQQAQFGADNPITDTAAEIGGAAAAPGFGLARAVGGGPLAARMAKSAGAGAGISGLYGFGEGEGGIDGRTGNALQAASFGAGVGAIVPVAGQGINRVAEALSRRGGNQALKKAAPSIEGLRNQADDLYSAARAKNATFEGFPAFADETAELLQREGFRKSTEPKVAKVMRQMQDMRGMGGQAPVLPNLDDLLSLRKLAADAAMSADGAERRIGRILRGQLDDYIERAGSVPEVAQGRALVRQRKQAETILDAATRAERRAATNITSTDAAEVMKRNVRQILDSPRKRSGFNETQIEAMEEFIRDGSGQKLARRIGRMSPTSGGASLMGNVFGLMLDPTFLAASATGMAGKAAANSITRGKASVLDAIVRSGGQRPQLEGLTPSRQRLIEALMRQAQAPITAN